MAGSLKFFKYTTNGGVDYAIRMDESNGEAISNTDLVAADLPIPGLPRNITPRYVIYRSADGLHTRTIPVTSNTVDLEDLVASFAVPAPTGTGTITVIRQSLIGERQRAITNLDTGQTDGDAE